MNQEDKRSKAFPERVTTLDMIESIRELKAKLNHANKEIDELKARLAEHECIGDFDGCSCEFHARAGEQKL